MKILVTGASGGYGRYALDYLKVLKGEDVELFGLVRNEQNAKELEAKGVTPRIGDFNDVQSLKEAFKGIDRLLFVSVSVPGIQKNVVEAIASSDIEYVAYTSIDGIDYDKFGLEQIHRDAEDRLKALDVKSVFLRNNFYLEIVAPQLFVANKTSVFHTASTDRKVGWALKQDLAEAGAKVILDGTYEGALNFSGESVTYVDLAKAVEKAYNKPIEVKEVSLEEIPNLYSDKGLSEMGIGVVSNFQGYAINENNGESTVSKTDLERVLGRKVTPIEEAVKVVIEDPKIFL